MQTQPLSRRRFLKLGAVAATGVAALALWRYLPSARKADAPLMTPYGNLLVLDAAQAATFHAYAEAVLPVAKGFPSPQEAQVVQRLDEELYFVSPAIVDDVKLVLSVLEWLPLIYGHFSRFATLPAGQRLALVNRTKQTRSDSVRAVMNNCRMLCFNMYYGHASSWTAIGYDGPFSALPEKLGEQRRYYAQQTQVVDKPAGRGNSA